MGFKAASVVVALSKEVNRMEFYNPKRQSGWELYRLKEVLKEMRC